MAKVKVSSEVKAPVERVFELFTDIEHAADRVSGIKKIEVMSTGPFNLGYRWTETREVMGRLDNAAMEISAFERNRSYTITHHKGGVFGQRCAHRHHLHVRASAHWFQGALFSLSCTQRACRQATLLPLEWAIGGKVRHVLSEDLDDLMRAVETMTRT